MKLTINNAKLYFEKIFDLENSGQDFPVNLDEVWGLVYTERGNCVRELKKNYIEGVDFNLIQNDKVLTFSELQNGVKTEYLLSVSCMEYLVVRKNRQVFEVYRAFRQKVQRKASLSPAEQLLHSAQLLVEHEKRMNEMEERLKLVEAKSVTRPDYMTIAGYGTINNIPFNLKIASSIGRVASKICKERGLPLDSCPDPRFGKVNMYPSHILDEVINKIEI